MKIKIFLGITFFFVILLGVLWGTGEYRLREKELTPEVSDVLQYADEELNIEGELDNINAIYGSYKITDFLPTQYYRNMKYDVMPEQEADMLLEWIVVIGPEILITYDTERSLGTIGGREAFDGNYMIETYKIENPQYDWNTLETDVLTKYPQPNWEMEQAIGKEYLEQLEAVISTPQLCSEPYGVQYFYTLKDKDKLIMYSGFTNQYFLLERCTDELEEELPEWTDYEKEELLKEIYGEYQVMEFLPTEYYPALDSNGYEILPKQEADMMIGQKILFSEDCFTTYDNYRRPNSYITRRSEDDFWLEKAEVEDPQYEVKSVRGEEIYGICEGILAKETEGQIYVQIDVYPGYETNGSKLLPQLFLIDDGKIVLYSMGEYFLLEKIIETKDFTDIMRGDYSSLDEVADVPIYELKALIRHGYCQWNLCDVNGDKKEELILCEKQENVGDDIRCIIGIFAETGSGVECVFWDTDHSDYKDEFYAIVDGKLVNYQEMYDIYRYASYSRCYFDEMWEIQKENQFEIIQIDNLELYNEYNQNGEWCEIKRIASAEEGDYYRYTSYEDADARENSIMLQKDEWMDKFQKELTVYESVEKILGKGFYASMNRDLVSEEEDFEEIMQGDMSSLYQLDEEDRNFIKELAENGCNEWNLCDVNGDGKQELILQERQGELEGNIYRITGVFAETEDGVKQVLWDVFETGEFYSFIDGKLLYYNYVNGIYNADMYTRYFFDDTWELKRDRLFEVLDINSLEEYESLSDEMKKEIPKPGLYFLYVIYGENDERNTVLMSEEEWRDKFREEMGEYGRVSTIMQGFAPFDIYTYWGKMKKVVLLYSDQVPMTEEKRKLDVADYSLYLKKIWIVDGWETGWDYPVSLVITEVEEGNICGYLKFDENILPYYCNMSSYGEKYACPFQGIVYDGVAECEYIDSYYNKQGVFQLTFCGNGGVEVELEGDEAKQYLLRPYGPVSRFSTK